MATQTPLDTGSSSTAVLAGNSPGLMNPRQVASFIIESLARDKKQKRQAPNFLALIPVAEQDADKLDSRLPRIFLFFFWYECIFIDFLDHGISDSFR